MGNSKVTEERVDNSYRNAHLFNEFAKTLQNIGADIENSVSLFDKIGEKNEMFQRLEKSIHSPSIEPIINMHRISKREIYDFVYRNFVKIFIDNKEKFNFIHSANSKFKKIIFFISTKDDETMNLLLKTEFEYATGELAEFIDVSFCFVENDMEASLCNTDKIEFANE